MKGKSMKRILKILTLFVLTLSIVWIFALPTMADPTFLEVTVGPKKDKVSQVKVSEVSSVIIKVKNNGPLIKDVILTIDGENSKEITPFTRIETKNPKLLDLPLDSVYFGNSLKNSTIEPGKTKQTAYFFNVPVDTELSRYNLKYTLTYKTRKDNTEITETKQDVFPVDVIKPNPFVLGLRWLLDMLAKLATNYGLAVILFAILIKVLLWPLNTVTMKSQAQMQQLQPKINEINQKYKDDPKQKNEEVMRLYKEEKINPASSCLYLLPQLVVLWLLYSALQGYTPLYQQSFLWLTSLGRPILAGVSTFFQSLSSGQANDPQTKTFTYIMPIFFFYIMMRFPAALSIFWTVFGLVSWGQQHLYMRNHPRPLTSAVEVKSRSNNKVGKK
jgi:YidC/Oxa1 family membrane protein insertase